MMQIAFVGIGAGAASALLFASVASGSLLSIFLFYAAPLPILIAALGWSHWAGLIAAAGAASALGVVFGGLFFLAFAIGTGLPAWWLGYLTMLARPTGNGHTEWYPPGRLVLWAAGFAAIVVTIGVLNLGTDFDGVRLGLRQALERIVRFESDTGNSTRTALINFLTVAIPPAAAVLTTLTNLFNLWMAGRVVKFSGRLQRPWPELKTLEFPRLAVAALAAAAALSFVGGLASLIAAIVTASLLTAFGILGFAVLHALTTGMKGRAFVIVASYAAVFTFGWPILALCLLGVIDNGFNLRARAGKRGPSAPT